MTSAKLHQLADGASPEMKSNIDRALSGGVPAAVCQSCGAVWPEWVGKNHYCWARIGDDRCKGTLILAVAKTITHRPHDYPEAGFKPPADPSKGPAIRMPSTRGPNKTEQRFIDYITALLRPAWIKYEPITLRLPSGTRYTPDVGVYAADGLLRLYEVKGPYIYNERSIHAFKEAVSAFPFFHFVFAQWKGGEWRMTKHDK